jgi:chromosome segregation ATPase
MIDDDITRPTNTIPRSGELRDLIEVFDTLDNDIKAINVRLDRHEKTLDEHGGQLAGHESKLLELEKMFGKLDQICQTFENQIQIFRDGIQEELRRFKLGINIK